MKNATKGAMAFACALILSLAVAACGGGGGSDTTQDSSGQAALQGTVTYWDNLYKLYPEYTEVIKQIDKEFEKENPGVKVERVSQPNETYITLVRTTMLSGEPPDALSLYPGNNGILTFAPFLEPLNDLIDPELEDAVYGWASSTPGLTEEGTHYGMPSSPNGNAFYYNKKLFAKAGLPTDFHPETWAELRETAEKLQAAGIKPFTDGAELCEILCSWMFGLGLQTELSEQEIGELQTGEMSYEEPQVAKAFQPLIDLYDAGLFDSEVFNVSQEEGWARFEEEEGAMVLGLWSIAGSAIQFAPKIGEENLGIFPAPGSYYSTFASSPRALPKEGDNKEATLALLEFELSQRSQQLLTDKGGALPLRSDVTLPPKTPKQTNELLKAQSAGETGPFPLIVLDAETTEVLDREFAQVLQGRLSVADAQRAMQESAEKAFQEQEQAAP